MYADTDSIKVGDPDYTSSYHSKEEIDRLVEQYKSRKARLSSVYGVMCAGPDPDGKVKALLSIPDPWEGIIDDGIDCPYSVSEYPLLDLIDRAIIALMQKNWNRED